MHIFKKLSLHLCLICLALFSSSILYASSIVVTYQDGETQSMTLHQEPGSIRSVEIGAYGDRSAVTPPTPGNALPVTVYWHMADDADLYLNGRPLRRYEPSFRTRGDEAPLPAFSASVDLRQGDVFTVGGRRGGSYGFMLIAVDINGQVVFQSDQRAWKVYEPGDRPDWYLPAVAKAARSYPVIVQPDPWYPQKTLNSQHGNSALSIWSSPDQRFAYMYGIVRFMR